MGDGHVVDIFCLVFEVGEFGDVVMGVVAGREVAGMFFQEMRAKFGGTVKNAE